MKRLRFLILVLLTFFYIGVNAQGIVEKTVKATQTLETGLSFVYQNVTIPVLNVTYHEFSADNITWRKNYVNGDCYVRFANVTNNTVSKHSGWWTLDLCNLGNSGLDTIYVDYGTQIDTLTSADYTVKMNLPDTITGSTANTQDSLTHTHAIQIYLNDIENVDTNPTDGQVMKFNAATQKWIASNDLLLSGEAGGLRVRTESGDVNVSAVTELRVPTGRLVNNGSGSVSLVLTVEPVSGVNDYWRAGIDTVLTTGDHTITFSNPLPTADYIVANAYAQYTDSTRQSLSYGNLTVNGFKVFDIAQNVSYVHYMVIENVDSLLAVQAEIGKVKATASDPVYGYLDSKVDNTTISVSSNKLKSIATLDAVLTNGATSTQTATVGKLISTGHINATDVIVSDSITASKVVFDKIVSNGHINGTDIFASDSITAAKAVFGTPTNSTYFEADGTLVLRGDATVFDDIYPSSVSTAGGASAPSFTAYNGTLKAYEFVGNATMKELHCGFQLIHAYKEGTNITPHVHLYIPDDGTGGVVKFFCDYTWTNIDQTGAVTPTTISGTVTRTANQGIANNIILAFPDVVGTGKTISSIFMCRIYRDPTVAADTFTPSVWMKSADIHIEKDGMGSRTPTAK